MNLEKMAHSNEQMQMNTNNRTVRLQQHVVLLTVMERAGDLIKKILSHNLSFEIKRKLIKSYIWSVALYGPETWTLKKNEEMVVNAFETVCWGRMLKIKWTDRIRNDEAFQRAKEDRLVLKIKKKKIDATHG